MAASRLNDSQKQELVARYRQGETGQSLALAYGCSANTVSRVVRAALAPEELAALKKQARPRAGSVPVDPPAPPAASAIAAPEVESVVSEPEPAVAAQVVERDASGVLAIDDADDFGDDGLDEFGEDDIESGEAPGMPAPRPLREFTELGSLPAEEQDRRALMLYANPRQAKRQCGRSQRVIKVPDSGLLERRSSYLVAQGITRLVLEGGSLFAIPGC